MNLSDLSDLELAATIAAAYPWEADYPWEVCEWAQNGDAACIDPFDSDTCDYCKAHMIASEIGKREQQRPQGHHCFRPLSSDERVRDSDD